MELKFNKSEEGWVAEFKVTSSFSLHIEGVVEGNVKVCQRSTPSGEYAYTREGTPSTSYGKVYDFTFPVLVGPKFMKVVCVTEPTYGEVVTDGEVAFIGGGAPDMLDLFYFDLSSTGAAKGVVMVSELEEALKDNDYVTVTKVSDKVYEIAGGVFWGAYWMNVRGYITEMIDGWGEVYSYPQSMLQEKFDGYNGEPMRTYKLASGITLKLINTRA